jgi:phage shock protein A
MAALGGGGHPVGFIRRMSSVFRARAQQTLERYEDPRETLDYFYERQLESLQKRRRKVADLQTVRKTAELQLQQLEEQSRKLDSQLTLAREQDREELVRDLETRQSQLDARLRDMARHYAQLRDQVQRLLNETEQMTTRITAFRLEKERYKAIYGLREAGNESSQQSPRAERLVPAGAGAITDLLQIDR